MCDRRAATSSAVFLVILLFSNHNMIKVKTFFKPFAILITPADHKIFPLRSSCQVSIV